MRSMPKHWHIARARSHPSTGLMAFLGSLASFNPKYVRDICGSVREPPGPDDADYVATVTRETRRER